MTEDKKVEILALINAEWDNYTDRTEQAKEIMEGYIFGPLGQSEHYSIDEIYSLIKEVELEKAPSVVETPIEEQVV